MFESTNQITFVPSMNFSDITISDDEFGQFQGLILKKTGIYLTPHKKQFIISRLNKRLKSLKIKSFYEYYKIVNNPVLGNNEIVHLINQITTNTTEFFRQNCHFNYFDSLIQKHPGRKMNIWSAGCSSGEEAYCMAIRFEENNRMRRKVDYSILATDIDTSILTQARQGYYSLESVKKVPEKLIDRYFETVDLDDETVFRVKPVIKSKVTFQHLNFVDEVYPIRTKFDIIFFRNVMIYFQHDIRLQILDKFFQLLNDGGYLFIGHSESLNHLKTKFKHIQQNIYQKV